LLCMSRSLSIDIVLSAIFVFFPSQRPSVRAGFQSGTHQNRSGPIPYFPVGL
jgi:hypothetical protein